MKRYLKKWYPWRICKQPSEKFMARKNLDQAKKVFRELRGEILSYGEEGENDLEDLFESHKPNVIFKLAPGPERDVLMSQLLNEMREIRSDLARAHHVETPESGGSVRVSRIGIEIPGVYDGFRYVLAKLPNGRWGAKITRRGRQILDDPDHPDAPIIVGSPALNRVFESQQDAEDAVHRVIRKAMIWYEEQGIIPMEKRRKTQHGRAGIQRRTAGQVAERERQASEAKAAKAEKRRRERVRKKRGAAKVQRLDRPPRTKAAPVSRGRKLVYIPKKNPSNPFTFLQSTPGALEQAKKAVQKYKEWEERWDDSIKSDNPDFKAVFKAYDHIVNAKSNFTLAEESELASKAEGLQHNLRKGILDILVTCNREMRKKRTQAFSASSADEPKAKAASHMKRATEEWDKYGENDSPTSLLNAYKHLELAKESFQRARDREGTQEAATRIRLAKQEIKNRMKG